MADKYPHGKLRDDDQGETMMAISVQGDAVVITFPKSLDWIGLDKRTAINVARTIMRRASEIPDDYD